MRFVALAFVLSGCFASCPEPGHVGADAVPGCGAVRLRELHPAELCFSREVVLSIEPGGNAVDEVPFCVADASGTIYRPLSPLPGEAFEAGLRGCTADERAAFVAAAESGLLGDCAP